MAPTGRDNGIDQGAVYGSAVGASSSIARTGLPTTEQSRLALIMIDSATATCTTPSGWVLLYSTVANGWTYYLFWQYNGSASSPTSVTFSFSASVAAIMLMSVWAGVDPDSPLQGEPMVAGSASAVASMVIPDFNPADGCGVGVWWWAQRWTSNGSSKAITLDANLISLHSNDGQTANTVIGKAGMWTDASYNGLQTPNTPGSKTSTTATTTGAGHWGGMAVALRPEKRARFLAAAA